METRRGEVGLLWKREEGAERGYCKNVKTGRSGVTVET